MALKGFTWFIYNIEPNNAINPALFNSEGNFNAGRSSLWPVAAQINGQLGDWVGPCRCCTAPRCDLCLCLIISSRREPPSGLKGPEVTPTLPISIKSMVNLTSPSAFSKIPPMRSILWFRMSPMTTGWEIHPSITVAGGRYGSISIFPGHLPEQPRDHLLTLNKDTGQVQRINLTASNGTTGHINVTLGEGDVKLFKYATGRSFAMQ